LGFETRIRFAGPHLLYEGQQRLAVVLPLFGEVVLVGELVAAQEDAELKAVGVQVAEVVHTCRETET